MENLMSLLGVIFKNVSLDKDTVILLLVLENY